MRGIWRCCLLGGVRGFSGLSCIFLSFVELGDGDLALLCCAVGSIRC